MSRFISVVLTAVSIAALGASTVAVTDASNLAGGSTTRMKDGSWCC